MAHRNHAQACTYRMAFVVSTNRARWQALRHLRPSILNRLAVETDPNPTLLRPRIQQTPAEQPRTDDSVVSGVSGGRTGISLTEDQRSSPCAMTLRMTFGSASSASVEIGTQRIPRGARAPGETRVA